MTNEDSFAVVSIALRRRVQVKRRLTRELAGTEFAHQSNVKSVHRPFQVFIRVRNVKPSTPGDEVIQLDQGFVLFRLGP